MINIIVETGTIGGHTFWRKVNLVQEFCSKLPYYGGHACYPNNGFNYYSNILVVHLVCKHVSLMLLGLLILLLCNFLDIFKDGWYLIRKMTFQLSALGHKIDNEEEHRYT